MMGEGRFRTTIHKTSSEHTVTLEDTTTGERHTLDLNVPDGHERRKVLRAVTEVICSNHGIKRRPQVAKGRTEAWA